MARPTSPAVRCAWRGSTCGRPAPAPRCGSIRPRSRSARPARPRSPSATSCSTAGRSTGACGRQFAFSVERGVKLRGLPITGSATFDVDARSRSVVVGLNLAAARACSAASAGRPRSVPPGMASRSTTSRSPPDPRASGASSCATSRWATPTPGAPRTSRGRARSCCPRRCHRPSPRASASAWATATSTPGVTSPRSTARWPPACSCSASASTSRSTRCGSAAASASAPGRGCSGSRRSRSTGTSRTRSANPDRYAISGSARVVDIPLASGSVSYQTDGRFDMSGQAKFKKFGVGFEGALQGWVDGDNAFNFQGKGSVHAGPFGNGGDAVVSSSGAAACRHGFGPDVGFGYGWGSVAPHIFASSCNVGDWVVGGSTRQIGPPTFGSFAIAGGQPAAVFSVVGSAGAAEGDPDRPGRRDGRRDAGRSARRHRRRQGPPVPEPRGPDDVRRGQGPGGRAVSPVAEGGLRARGRLPLGAVARRTAGAGAGRRPRPSPGAALVLHARARALGGVLRAGP